MVFVPMIAEPKFYWWGIVPYVRRFFLNLCVVVFRTRPSIQAVRSPPIGSPAHWIGAAVCLHVLVL